MFQASWLSPLANHLWQSTALVFVAWLLALALRKNQARTRYWVWLSASLKFLLPFSLLADMGRRIGSMIAAPMARPAFSSAMQQIVQITQPFPQTSSTVMVTPSIVTHYGNPLSLILLAIWTIGSLAMAISWSRKWSQIHAAARKASRLDRAAEVPVLSSSSLFEPGVFGIVQPVLLLPEGITNRLTESQLNAILAHEMCHVRRRDNLTFAMHMIVETLFWFHPMVWWIRMQLIEERERACDEAVLQSGSEAEVYAEGILNVCKFYVESPLACASGVTGSDLKKRIVRIMTERLGDNLGSGRKLLLASIALVAILGPVVFGLVKIPQASAQEQQSASEPRLSFEVATVKPNRASDNQRMVRISPGKFSAVGTPLKELILFAYDLKSDAQLTGGPAWIASDRFDIEAKQDEAQAQASSKLLPPEMGKQMRQMLQSLLADRFGLKVSHATKELPVYALVIAKGGPKLTPTTTPPMVPPGDQPPGDDPAKKSFNRGIRMQGNGDLTGMAAPTAFLADVLSRQPELGNRLVQDKTGLTGEYDWTLKWTPAAMDSSSSADSAVPPAGDPSTPSLFTAVQEQLGLKLEPQKGTVEIVVIDHVEQPSAN
jgi:bla regulator protein blaR1